jgi:hypothetical protein
MEQVRRPDLKDDGGRIVSLVAAMLGFDRVKVDVGVNESSPGSAGPNRGLRRNLRLFVRNWRIFKLADRRLMASSVLVAARSTSEPIGQCQGRLLADLTG